MKPARNEREAVSLRDRPIRVLGEDLHDINRLRALYPTLSNSELKDRVVRVAADEGSAEQCGIDPMDRGRGRKCERAGGRARPSAARPGPLNFGPPHKQRNEAAAGRRAASKAVPRK